jgi:hypothetical protein
MADKQQNTQTEQNKQPEQNKPSEKKERAVNPLAMRPEGLLVTNVTVVPAIKVIRQIFGF